MNKSIAGVLFLLFVQMLITALSIVWLKDIVLSSIGGICVILTLLVLHDMYVIKSIKRNRHERIWKRIAAQEREKKLRSDELFLTYDYATRDWGEVTK